MNPLIRQVADECGTPKKILSRFKSLSKRHFQPGRTTVFYEKLVPKEHREQIAYRKFVLGLGYASEEWARDLWIMASRDILWYLNSLGLLLEPRDLRDDGTLVENKVLPFNTFPFQDRAILQTLDALGKRDLAYDKSRAMGATWMALYLADHAWRFRPDTAIGLVSRNEKAADNPDDPDSLMSKLDFIDKHLPYWMRSARSRNTTTHSIVNLDNGSTINGYAATGDLGRGGRKTWFLMDELHFFNPGTDDLALSSTLAVSPSRLCLSTINKKIGASGKFYEMTRGPMDKRCETIVLDWKDHPDQIAGRYTSSNGVLIIEDREFWNKWKRPDGKYSDPAKPENEYQFIKDEKTRSVYFDRCWRRAGATPQSIAAEIERSVEGATALLFDWRTLEKARAGTKAPLHKGTIDFNREDFEPKWMNQEGGLVELWCQLDPDDNPPSLTEYVVGADCATGTGGDQSSNSAFVVIDRGTGEQVARYAFNRIYPVHYAQLLAATCKFFKGISGDGALLVVESNGPGGTVIKELQRIGYSNLYIRNVEQVASKKKTKKVGYHNSDGGEALLFELQRAMDAGGTVPRDSMFLDECAQYRYRDGKVIHASVTTTTDDGAKNRAHGDVVIAYACAWHGIVDSGDDPARPQRRKDEPQSRPLPKWRDPRILAHRIAEYELEDRAKESVCDW